MTKLLEVRALTGHSPAALRAEIGRLTDDDAVIARVLAGTDHLRLIVEPAPPVVTEDLRTVLERTGGRVILADTGGVALVVGTRQELTDALKTLYARADSAARAIATDLRIAISRLQDPLQPLQIGPLRCDWGRRTYVMGILNVTPDSFSGDGLLAESDEWLAATVERARKMVDAGADILDVGGESTRPGSTPVDEADELARVVPAVEAIADEVDVAISVDTYKAEVARQAIEAGAHLINDVWGLRMDPEIGAMAAEYEVPLVVMHNRSRPKNAVQEERLGGRYEGINYDNLMADVVRELSESIEVAMEAGVPWQHLIVDPGIGFGKTIQQNLILVNRLDELRVLGRPVLLGTSRKGFIGYTLDLPKDERVEGTGVTVALGIERGANIVRVHDVREMVRMARMTDAILREQREGE